MNRRDAREQAFILMFEISFQPDITMEELIKINHENGFIEEDDFANGLALKTCENKEEIDATIEKYSIARKISRISRVSISVLRIAVCEILYYKDIPYGVSINEAVEICKKYSSEDEYSFVNGILGSIVKDLVKE
ncbi:MAG: transcription antitermination factor NusB [Clostridia bacterium]|nr:transcription antitermination factor NusB [Clostridia bacterium]